MTTTASKTATTYAAAYATLATIAEKLKANGNASTIDTLAQDVAAAKVAYSNCKLRLAAIRAEIEAELAASEEVPAR